jgi:hypothetical protein
MSNAGISPHRPGFQRFVSVVVVLIAAARFAGAASAASVDANPCFAAIRFG